MKKIILSLGVCIFLFSCSDGFEEAQKETVQENSTSYAQRQGNKHLVTLEEAQLIATKKIPILDGPCNNRLEFPIFTDIEIGDVITILDKQKNPAMYLFNKSDGKGFLLMSASKLEEPILAYSNSSTMDLKDLPPTLGIWLHLGVTKISQLNKMRAYYNVSVYDAWAAYGITAKARDYYLGDQDGNPHPLPEWNIERIPIGMPCVNQQTKIDKLLGNISWGQKKGYNKYQNNAPSTSKYYKGRYDYKYPAGCVMVAFGQIMKYHGDFGSFIANNDVADKVMGEADYDGVSLVLKELYDITKWTSQDEDGTGAYPFLTAGAITNSAIFSSPFVIFSSFDYLSATYAPFSYATIHDNLEEDLPVVVSGFSVKSPNSTNSVINNINYSQNNQLITSNFETDSGHAWVCDGYLEEVQKIKIIVNGEQVDEGYETTREFWHMNWGWHYEGESDGRHNGWFRDEVFNPHSPSSVSSIINYGNTVGYEYNSNNSTETYHEGYYYGRSLIRNIRP